MVSAAKVKVPPKADHHQAPVAPELQRRAAGAAHRAWLSVSLQHRVAEFWSQHGCARDRAPRDVPQRRPELAPASL